MKWTLTVFLDKNTSTFKNHSEYYKKYVRCNESFRIPLKYVFMLNKKHRKSNIMLSERLKSLKLQMIKIRNKIKQTKTNTKLNTISSQMNNNNIMLGK